MIEGMPKLVLDPRNDDELREQAIQRAKNASNGRLTDDSPGSVLAALVEGGVYSVAELLYFLNMLPEASALEVFRLAGVSRSPGTRARGSLTFLLSIPLGSAFVVPAGYVVPYSPPGYTQGNTGYKLLENLVIPPGAIEGSAQVEATTEGIAMNSPAYGVTITQTSLTYCQSIYNVLPITGGNDLEPLQAYVERAQRAIRSRDVLVSQTDFEQYAADFLGQGSATKAIPFLSSDRTSERVGDVHVFGIYADGTLPNNATCSELKTTMQRLSFISSRVWVSPCELETCNVQMNVQVSDLGTKDAIWQAVQEFFSPASFKIGGDIRLKRLEATIAAIPGVVECISTLIDGEPYSKPMSVPYGFPLLDLLQLTCTDVTGLSETTYFGTTIGDPF